MAILSTHRRPLRLVLVVVFLAVVCFFTFSSYYDLEPPLSRSRPFAYVHTSGNWARRKQKYPPGKLTPLPSGPPQKLRKIQHTFASDVGAQESRRQDVRKTFKKSWSAYSSHAWGRDELHPISLTASDTFSGYGATLIDALDTLAIMDMKSEFAQALSHVASVDWNKPVGDDPTCSLFETTIRYLGGLLSAYDLSNETVLLRKAIELGDMLYAGFDTPNRLPVNAFNFEKARNGELSPSTREISANVGSLSMEFTRLAQLTGDDKYFDAIDRVKKRLYETQDETKLPGMWPQFVDVANGLLVGDGTFTLGSMADSLYEYLPKMYVLLGGLDDAYKEMYTKAMTAAKNHLLFRPMLPNKDVDILFSGNVLSNGQGTIDLIPQTQHLTCFVGGMFAMGGKLFDIPKDVEIGERLARGCAWAYKVMPTHVMPEEMRLVPCPDTNMGRCAWDEGRWEKEGNSKYPKGISAVYLKSYLLRPEAIESVFYLWRITGDEVWRDTAWEMFIAIKKVTSTDHGNSAIRDTTAMGGGEKMDSQEVGKPFFSSPSRIQPNHDPMLTCLEICRASGWPRL